jgi:hypothetical protein
VRSRLICSAAFHQTASGHPGSTTNVPTALQKHERSAFGGAGSAQYATHYLDAKSVSRLERTETSVHALGRPKPRAGGHREDEDPEPS